MEKANLKKYIILTFQFIMGFILPILLGFIASVLSYYNQIFVNTSILFVIGIPLFVSIKLKNKKPTVAYGILTGLFFVTGFIIYSFFTLAKVKNNL